MACSHGHASLVNLFVRHGVNVRLKGGPMMMNCLHHSCLHDLHQIVDLMLNLGCQVNTRDLNGNTPLHYCTQIYGINNTSGGQVLIKHGAICITSEVTLLNMKRVEPINRY